MSSEQVPENIRPWGRYDILQEEEGYKVKRLEINPHCRFSYQRHERRLEQWTVVKGRALVTLNENDIELEIGETVLIPLQAKHRLTNKRDVPLVVIEVQIGPYLEEDDIERFDDDYGRI